MCDPAVDIPEGEPCLTFPDTFNGGCASDGSIHTSTVHCGDAICGSLSSDFTTLDRDVYAFTSTGYDSLIWCVEFDRYAAQISIVEPLGGCGGGNIIWAQAGSYTGCEMVCAGACLPPGTYWFVIQLSQYGVNCGDYVAHLTCVPCIPSCVVCPATAIPEGESCPSYQGGINDGCFGPSPPATSPIACGDTICGTSTSYDLVDHDFYQLNLAQIDSVVWCVTAEYPVQAAIVYPSTNCASLVPIAINTGPACTTVCVSACLNPGTYWLYTRPTVNLTGQCKRYVASVNCYPCTAPPDTCRFASLDTEPANNTCQPSPAAITCGDTLCGRIFSPGTADVDWYQVSLPGGTCTHMLVDVYGNDTPGWYPYGLGLDPRVSLWASDCTTLLGFDDNSGTGNDASMSSPCLPAGQYFLRIEGVSASTGPYVFTITCDGCQCPCSLSCPTNWPGDGEACPNFGPDTYNGGCTLTPPAFGQIACGQRFCGTSFAMGGVVDQDWFQLVLPQPRRILWNVAAEFPFDMAIYKPNPNCGSLLTIRQASGAPCQAKFVFVPCLPAGTYYLYIAPSVSTGVPCSDYLTRLACGKCFIIDVTVVLTNGNSDLKLAWSPDETAPGYNVYRSDLPNVDPVDANLVGSTQDTTFIDPVSLGTPATKYFYTVTMQNPDSVGDGEIRP